MKTDHPAGSATGIDLAELMDANPLADAFKLALGTIGLKDHDEAVRIAEMARDALARATPQQPQCTHDYREQSRDVAGNRYFSCIHCHAAKTAAATPQHSVTEQASAYILRSKATGERSLVWPSIARNYSAESYEKILLTQPLASTAATQPEKASIKTWQERSEAAMGTATWYPAGHYKDEEIADLRAALAIPASTAASEQQAGADELPSLPAQHDELRARWKCEDCAGTGEVGELMDQGYFQPPERARCSTCDGAGQVPIVAYTDDQMHDYARAALTHRATTATPGYTARIGEDGEYELHRDGRQIGTVLFRDDAERIMRALAATPDIATTADQQGDTASASIGNDPKFRALLAATHQADAAFKQCDYDFSAARNAAEADSALIAYIDGRAQQGAAQAQADEARDAGRYRFLVDRFEQTTLPCFLERQLTRSYVADGKASIDTAIDAAMAAPATSGGKP